MKRPALGESRFSAICITTTVISRLGNWFWKSNCRVPHTNQVGCLMITRPWWHCHTNEFEWLVSRISILKGCSDRYVDGDPRGEARDTFFCFVFSPYFAITFKHIPEFADCGMNSCRVRLPRWNRAVDHVAGVTIHQEANVRTGRRFCIHLFR